MERGTERFIPKKSWRHKRRKRRFKLPKPTQKTRGSYEIQTSTQSIETQGPQISGEAVAALRDLGDFIRGNLVAYCETLDILRNMLGR